VRRVASHLVKDLWLEYTLGLGLRVWRVVAHYEFGLVGHAKLHGDQVSHMLMI
jgi:hypothetical protein